MNRNDIDFTPFPNCGNNPFYMNEFNIANMLPTVPVTGPAITKALDTNDIDAINEILMNNSIISEKSSHDDKHPLYLWHGSSGNYPVVTGHVSTHGKKWVYATPDYNFALCYAGDKWNDFEINQSYYNGKLYLTEIEPDIFKKKFNRVGFMYRLPAKEFSPIKKDAVKQWKEWECPHDVIPEKVIQIDNILDELKKSGVILYEYPSLPPFIHNRNEYIKNKTLELLKMTNDEGIKDYVHKKFPDVVLEKKIERKNDKGEDVPEKCPKCGSPVKLVLRGEPVWVCSNKKCNKYFGTLPFNLNESVENINESTTFNQVKKIVDNIPQEEHHYFYHGDQFKDSPYVKYRNARYITKNGKKYGAFIDVYSFDSDPETGIIVLACEPQARGYGLTDKLIKDAKNNMTKCGYTSLFARIDVDNIYSQKVAERNGFIEISRNEEQIKYAPISKLQETALFESYIIDKPDLVINLDKWRVGCPLWITGAPGDGKSTLSNQYKDKYDAIVVHTDTMLMRMSETKEKYQRDINDLSGEDPISLIYIQQHPEIQYNRSFKDGGVRQYHMAQFYKYFEWLIEFCKNPPAPYNKNRIIIEGCDICILDSLYMCDQPLIILGCSRFTSDYRRIKRMMGRGKSFGVALLKLLKSKREWSNELSANKERFYNSIYNNSSIQDQNIENESVDSHTDRFLLQYMAETAKRSELPDSVFGIPEERKYPMPDKKHVISAIKLFGHVDKKYEEELAKRIIKNIRKYDIDVSFVTKNNKLYKYLLDSNLVKESVSLYEQFFLSPC